MTTMPAERVPSESFESLYSSTRGDLYRALAIIAEDRDLATEAIDVGFTKWRAKLRRPSHVPPDVGVMALAYRWARRQLSKSSPQLRGFRLPEGEQPGGGLVDRLGKLSLDDRALVVMRTVLGWSDEEISHAVGADATGGATRAVLDRLAGDGHAPEQVAEMLRDRSATYTEPLSRLEAVRTKGMLRRVGLAAGSAVLLAGVLGAGAAVVGSLGSSGPEATTTIAAGSTPTGPGLTAENAVWQRVSPPVSSENVSSLAFDGTNFYLVGNDNQGRPVMMQSDNGLDWAQIPAPAGGQNMWFQQIVASDDTLVAVGNGFDEIRGIDSTLVFTSTEDGSWNRAELPFENQIEIGGNVFNLYTWVSNVYMSDAGFTVVANQGAEFDPEQLLRDVVDPSLFRNGYGTSSQGIQFFDSQGNQIETMTWEELGLDPAVGALMGGGRPIIFSSSDGLEWESSTTDLPPNTGGVGGYAKVGDAEAVLAYGDFGSSVWARHGGEWERPELDGSLSAMTVWNDELIVSGFDSSTGQPALWASTDAVNWNRRDTAAGGIQQFFTSAEGIVGIAWGDASRAIGPAEIEAGDLTVLAFSDGRFEVLDASGETVIDVYSEDASQGDTISITNPDTGETVVEFARSDYEQAWETVYRESEFAGGGQPSVSLIVSSDGVNWNVLQSADPNFYPNAVAYGKNSLLLVGWSEGNNLPVIGGGGMQMWLVTPQG